MGLHILRKIVSETFDMQERQLLLGNKDVSRLKKEIINYRRLIENFIEKLSRDAKNNYEINQRIDALSEYSEIVQAARDGIIIKQEKRTEQVGEEKKEIIYDTTMSPREVENILVDYEKQSYKMQMDKLDNYLGIGLSLASIIGSLVCENGKEEQKENLLTILREMNFNNPNLLKELACKKFMEFSTGQQKRLALSKLFYRVDDGTSVIIVDEPVGNVEDKLIREQLEMIKRYAER